MLCRQKDIPRYRVYWRRDLADPREEAPDCCESRPAYRQGARYSVLCKKHVRSVRFGPAGEVGSALPSTTLFRLSPTHCVEC